MRRGDCKGIEGEEEKEWEGGEEEIDRSGEDRIE
jgi:hypothetical protein